MRRSKVVVIGPSEVGKSTLIRLLCSHALNLEYRGRTVSMDHATLRRNGANITVIGVPGQPRFAPVREVLSKRASGVIWVHPAGQLPDPSTIQLLKQEFESTPYLVIVNQRAGQGEEVAFCTPPSFPAPREIIIANLIEQKGLSQMIEGEIWKLVQE